jgi:hypothetical protein
LAYWFGDVEVIAGLRIINRISAQVPDRGVTHHARDVPFSPLLALKRG